MRKFLALPIALLLALPIHAADVAISGLPAASSVAGTDVAPISQSGTTRKATATQIGTYVRSTVTQADVGLGNLDNTSDANKPVSTATQTALDLKAPLASPALTGTPTAPTAAAGTNTTQIATTAGIVAERTATRTLTGASVSGSSNTLSSIGNGSLTNSSISLNGGSISLGGSRTLSLAGADFANQGTTTAVLHGNAAGNPSWGAVSLTADVSGVLPLANTDLSTPRTWTAAHTWSLPEPRLILIETDQGSDLKWWDLDVSGGVACWRTRTDLDATGQNILCATRSTTTAISNLSLGNATNNPTGTWLGTGTFSFGGGVSASGNISASGGSISGESLNPNGTSVPTVGIYRSSTNNLDISTNATRRVNVTSVGQMRLTTLGSGYSVSEGSNAKMGVSTLSGGTVVVSTTAVTASSRIFLTPQTLGTVVIPSACGVSARTAGTSFTILCSQATDTSVIAWLIFEPS